VADHPVKVPEELVKKWMAELYGTPTFIGEVTIGIADRAAQWGWDQREPELQERADQELEACEQWMRGSQTPFLPNQAADFLRAARRPKPPSLAEQGMEALQLGKFPSTKPIKDLRAALNRLAELEAQNG